MDLAFVIAVILNHKYIYSFALDVERNQPSLFTNNSGSLESPSLQTGTTDSSFSTEIDIPGRLLKRRLSPFTFNASSESIAYFIKKEVFS